MGIDSVCAAYFYSDVQLAESLEIRITFSTVF